MSQISEQRERFLAALPPRLREAERTLITRALSVAEQAHHGQLRGTGEDYVSHPLAVAEILIGWQVDAATLAAALLHDVPEDTAVTQDSIEQEFGTEIAGLVASVTKLSAVRVPRENINYEAENLRRLFMAMARDLRVVLLKLADRLHNMRTIKGVSPAKRQRIGRETLEIYAPLADRLGMGEVRSELADRGFRTAQPDDYAWTKRQVEQSYNKSTRYMALVKREFETILRADGIEATVSSRTKNLYSLYQKLLQKDRDIDKIYDFFAIRVIVPSVEQCYQGMGIIHQHWQPLPHRIKDYIAVPKLNGYRSLHTTLFGPDQRLLEVQFRTAQMHQEAELGVAAHAVYAEQKESAEATPEQLAVLEQLASWQDELTDSPHTVDRFKLDLFNHRIFAFTPKGALYSLPTGATPVDFAYHVHTEVGNTCQGAKVNGVMVPLDTVLSNGDVVEILTRQNSTPKRDWLTFVRTGQARSHIRAHYRRQDRGQQETKGRELLEERLQAHQLSINSLTKTQLRNLQQVVDGVHQVDEVLALLGEGALSVNVVLKKLGLEATTETKPAKPKPVPSPSANVPIAGLSSLLTKRALCCNPTPPQDIVGYITVGKGISIHRRSCHQLQNLPDPNRLLEVSWGAR